MAIKIDLAKAYDQVSWSFLRSILMEIGLPNNWVSLIMSCVTSTQLSVLWNGETTESFAPGRDLRQGDPLSPYLFVLCLEKLSHIIQDAVSSKRWKPIQIGRKCPPISHLFFADDLMLFAEASRSQMETILQCLEVFCDISGQVVSLPKSKMYVSPNFHKPTAREISSLANIPLTADMGKYLGVPLIHKRVSKATYYHILEKVQQRLSGWKAEQLTMAGRTLLVQSVTSALPAYTMQTTRIPATISHEIDMCNCRFIWGSTEGKKKIHLVAWDKVCQPKENGGWG